MERFDPARVDLDRMVAALGSRAAREAERRRLRELTLQAARGEPLTGGWYWMPMPGNGGVTWQVQAFYDCWRSPSDHVCIWRHVRDALEAAWMRRLTDIECYSLPRGRVSRRADNNQLVVYHGQDAPRGAGRLTAIRCAFNLPRSTPAAFDEHEQCIAGQPEALSRALRCGLGIKGVQASTLDWI